MNLPNLSLAIFVFVISALAVLRIRGIRKDKSYDPSYGSQRMCRACGSITPRSEACCMQCGKPLPVI